MAQLRQQGAPHVALAHDPELLFLDEPTAGVDVELRKDMWQQIAALKAELASVQAQQQAIAREIARLEAERGVQPTDAPLPPAETPGAARGPQHA